VRPFRFSPGLPQTPAFSPGDGLILLGLTAALYMGARLAIRAPAVISGPEISLSFSALPWYALLSTTRTAAAYALALVFSLAHGYAAARNLTAERTLMPLLDVLQSVPILSFLPVVQLSLSAVLPQGLATEVAAVVLVFTSQAWNMTQSFYQSTNTIPAELRDAAAIFRLDPWLRFKTMELPFAAVGLIRRGGFLQRDPLKARRGNARSEFPLRDFASSIPAQIRRSVRVSRVEIWRGARPPRLGSPASCGGHPPRPG